MLLSPLEAYMYNISCLLADWAEAFDLKYLKTLLTFLVTFTEIERVAFWPSPA